MKSFDARLLSIEQATDFYFNKNNVSKDADSDNTLSFRDILKSKSTENEVVFSKHANQRLESRNITLSEAQLGRLNQGVDKARNKSINESLVMMDNLAFIVNVKNNMVVTAMEQGDDTNVFTNIDGAVIV